MKKKRKKIIIASLIFIIIIIGIIYVIKNIEIKKIDDEYQDYTPEEEISEDEVKQTKVILYFENIDTGELEAETQIVDADLLINEPYKLFIEKLIKGPQGSKLKKIIPDGTILNDVKIENGCAIINFSNEFLNYESETEKLKVINSIVNSLTNLKEINSVSFLINGEKNEKISETYKKTI